MSAFLDEVITPFYTAAPTSQEKFAFGQIFRAHSYYPHQRLDIWRPKVLDLRIGTASDFNIESSAADAFKRQLPYTSPQLEANEEFIAIKAKPRPIVLLQPPDSQLALIKKGVTGGKIARHLCVAALVFSAEKANGDAKFPAQWVERIRRLEYPEFMFLPKGGPITRDSILRLDEVQSVAIAQLQPTAFSLSSEIAAILRSQVSFYLSGLSGDEFAGWATLLK